MNAQAFSVQTAEIPAWLCHLDPTAAQSCLFAIKLHKPLSICLRRHNWWKIEVFLPNHLDNEKPESVYMSCIFHPQKRMGFIMHIPAEKWTRRAKSRKAPIKRRTERRAGGGGAAQELAGPAVPAPGTHCPGNHRGGQREPRKAPKWVPMTRNRLGMGRCSAAIFHGGLCALWQRCHGMARRTEVSPAPWVPAGLWHGTGDFDLVPLQLPRGG